jgi:plasmid stabilization system protein ParE
LALTVRIKPRALRQIHRAAQWWSENRPAAAGAIDFDLEEALDLLVEQPAIGGRVDNARDAQVRRFYLVRSKYFIYYRAKGEFLEVIAFWHASREQEPRV